VLVAVLELGLGVGHALTLRAVDADVPPDLAVSGRQSRTSGQRRVAFREQAECGKVARPLGAVGRIERVIVLGFGWEAGGWTARRMRV
jgi:hypothetical protein